MNLENQMATLRRCRLSLPEWYVLATVGMWPIPFQKIGETASSHSEGDPRGTVTRHDCEKALLACIAKELLRVTDPASLEEIHSRLERNSKALGPVYGYPNIGDVDFTTKGAALYKRVRRQASGGSHDSSQGYCVRKEARKLRFYFRTHSAALRAISRSGKDPSVLSTAPAAPIGPWCVYWWERFPRGYYVDMEVRERFPG